MSIAETAPARTPPARDGHPATVIEVDGARVAFGSHVVFDGLDLRVNSGEILGFVGGSGQGKSVLMRAILGLVQRQAGTIRIFGRDVDSMRDEQRKEIDQRIGVLFQMGALFSSLTVLENVQVPMREHCEMSRALMDEVALLKLDMVGLPRNAASKLPSELSGGMIKRAGLARALAIDPELLFVDEPTSGLDPIGAAAFDELIAGLRDTLGLTVYMVTHDLDSLHTVCDRVAVLADKKVIAVGTIPELLRNKHPWIQEYFKGERGGRFVEDE
ncbi:MAG: ABC transporter ATP-binding protein [Acuticoccus sp.]